MFLCCVALKSLDSIRLAKSMLSTLKELMLTAGFDIQG